MRALSHSCLIGIFLVSLDEVKGRSLSFDENMDDSFGSSLLAFSNSKLCTNYLSRHFFKVTVLGHEAWMSMGA